jgi:hypothetical protein
MAVVRWWMRQFIEFEFWAPVIITVVVVLLALSAGGSSIANQVLAGHRSLVYATLATVFGALFGFLIATVSVMTGLVESGRLRLVTDGGFLPDIWKAMRATIRSLALATIVSLVALVVDVDGAYWNLLLYIVLFASLLVLFRFVRALWILEKSLTLAYR